MKAGIAATVALAAALGCGQAMADGNELLNHCQRGIQYLDTDGKDGNAFSTGYCLGVITGVTSLRGITNESLGEVKTCLPKPAPSNLQAARIAVKFMTDFPEHLNLDDGLLVLFALQRAYPCNK